MILLPLLFLLVPTKISLGQSCNPAAVHYIVRDEKGRVLSAAELKTVAELLPKKIDDADTDDFEVSLAADKKTFYWQDSTEWEKGTKVPALSFANAGTCVLHLGQATLEYHGKKMTLIFNIEIARHQNDRRPVVDSLPFAAGTFKLDLANWSHSTDQIIPASYWTKVKE